MPTNTRPPDNGTSLQAAGGRPTGVGQTYSSAGLQLLDNRYEPLPIRPCRKVPAVSRWSAVSIDEKRVEDWAVRFPDHGIGLRTGILVGLDIDIVDPDIAQRIHALATARLGDTLVRVGLWPKRLLLYQTDEPSAKIAVPGIEVLGSGQQFVAFGMHPDTGRPYYWPDGETPLDVALDDLPRVNRDAIGAFLAETAAFLPDRSSRRPRRSGGPKAPPSRDTVVREDSGLVVDGRDSWLSSIAYHVVWDAEDAGLPLDVEVLSARVWERFDATTDLSRPRTAGGRLFDLADARRKVGDKLRLLRGGQLASRASDPVETVPAPSTAPLDKARRALQTAIADACDAIAGWHQETTGMPAPQIGIRATVGLGKTTAARHHLLELRQRLKENGKPHRIVVFVPSHALAEEAADRWREEGQHVAVLHGYESRQPGSGTRVCRDVEAVRLAIQAGAPVHRTVCDDGKGHRCRFHATCLKQVNRREISEADIVFAAYDALWSGFGIETSSIGVLVIDEAFWPRAATETRALDAGTFRDVALPPVKRRRYRQRDIHTVDLDDLRRRAVAAFEAVGPGPVTRQALFSRGLSVSDCRTAVGLELDRQGDMPLRPGSGATGHSAAAAIARHNAIVRACAELWSTLANFLESEDEVCGRVVIDAAAPETGHRRITVRGVQAIHRALCSTPVLHLAATLRPDLARTILPRLDVTEIEAEAPHMALRLVTGGFGKSALIKDPRAMAAENVRRARKLADVVAYVTWEARRLSPGRALVITYKDCEAAFQEIPGVETGHFNAIAGLDAWKDVALLIVVGRPLPSSPALVPLAGSFFGHIAAGGYRWVRRGIRMRDGSTRTVSTIAHEDPVAETMRAAISDDELIQAIGRGRGVNRNADNPLEVHVLSDVALPLVHDSLAPWDMVAPDIVQCMLLAGIAVDSPADAYRLHPDLFTGPEQAKKAFQRSAFRGQTPMSNSYRGMSLKSAAYRRPGKGVGWQNAYWIEGDDKAAHEALTRCLGALAGWVPAAN